MNAKSIAAVALLSVVAANAATYESVTFDSVCEEGQTATSFTVKLDSTCTEVCKDSVTITDAFAASYWADSVNCGVNAETPADPTAAPAATFTIDCTAADLGLPATIAAKLTNAKCVEVPVTPSPSASSEHSGSKASSEHSGSKASSEHSGSKASSEHSGSKASSEHDSSSATSVIASFALVAVSVVAALL